MRILVTGSSGWLGQTLVPRLSREGHQVVGMDPVPSRTTQIVGPIDDRELVRATIRDLGLDAIVHAGARHKPNIETHRPSDFVAVNVQGTLNLLEAAVAPGSKVCDFAFFGVSPDVNRTGFRPCRPGWGSLMSVELSAGREGVG